MISGWIQYLVTTVHITTCKQTQLFPWENSSMCITYVTYRCSAHNKDIDVFFTEDKISSKLGSVLNYFWIAMISYKGNTPFVPLQHSQLEMAAVLEKVQEVLTSSREVQGSVLKATCDTLLSCATTYRSMKDIIQNHTFAVMVCLFIVNNLN